MLSRFRQWWLGLPHPLWTLSACKPFSPWCFLDDIAHWLFPITYGWSDIDLGLYHYPDVEPWISRMHDRSVEKYYRRKYPGYFDE